MAELALESYGGVLLFNLRLHSLAQARVHTHALGYVMAALFMRLE